MTKRAKVVWAIVGVLAVGIVTVVTGFYVLSSWATGLYLEERAGAPKPFEPQCKPNDAACAAWTEFRTGHPYPYQAIAAKRLADGTFALIVSEPAPVLDRAALDHLTVKLFGETVKPLRYRWYIGVDGWLEDVVLRVPSAPGVRDPLDDPNLRERIAVLHEALFGTTFGGDLELVGASAASSTHTAPNVQVSPREINAWMAEGVARWLAVNGTGEAMTWPEICAGGVAGAFVSPDNTIVILTFPTRFLTAAQNGDNAPLRSLRVPFRKFAVASEAVFGAMWTDRGQTAILARVRTQRLSAIPPLRFETFSLLAEQSSDQLAQSYERNTVLSGKLKGGDHELRDWAPIYLSTALIDTEFGALLNITDQMLKSWSEAGHVEYLYFNYPKPKEFPFDSTALSEVLEKKHGSTSVLFNWNTAGSAVVVRNDDVSILTAKQTGALPVTYGADGRPVDQGGADVYKYEDDAYEYFAGLGDPNLARVVQYTVMYQVFRAIAHGNTGNADDEDLQSVPARAKANAMLAGKTARLLDDVDGGRIQEPKELLDELVPALTSFREAYPNVTNDQLAGMLIDRSSPPARQILTERAEQAQQLRDDLAKQEASLSVEIEHYNSRVRRANAVVYGGENSADLDGDKAALEERQAELARRFKEQDALVEAINPFEPIRKPLWHLAGMTQDLDAIRREYVRINDVRPQGSIKTPSIVVSWNRKTALISVGGHNVRARALRFEPNASVEGMKLVDDGHGNFILQYHPSRAAAVEARATALARAVEHRRIRDVNVLSKMADVPARIRSRPEALGVAASEPKPAFGRLGERVYRDKSTFVEDLRKFADGNDCCIFVARDSRQVAYVARKNPSPPPSTRAYEVRDTTTLVDRLAVESRAAGEGKPVIFLGEKEAHVEALAIDVNATNSKLLGIVEAIGGGGGKGGGRGTVSGILTPDFNGRRSFLKTLLGPIESRTRSVLSRITRSITADVWRTAKVSRFEGEALQEVLVKAGWKAQDGVPVGVKMTFSRASEAPDVALVAGFSEAAARSGPASLQSAHAHVAKLAAENEGALAQYLIAMRDRVKTLPDAQVQRLILVVEDNEGRTLLTQLALPVEELTGV